MVKSVFVKLPFMVFLFQGPGVVMMDHFWSEAMRTGQKQTPGTHCGQVRPLLLSSMLNTKVQ